MTSPTIEQVTAFLEAVAKLKNDKIENLCADYFQYTLMPLIKFEKDWP